MNIYVGNLSYDVTEEDLKQAFEAFGQVELCGPTKQTSLAFQVLWQEARLSIDLHWHN